MFSALNRSSSRHCRFEPSSGHMWDKPSSAHEVFLGDLPFLPHLPIDSVQNFNFVSPFADDQTRVMIKNGTSGDYINANYVNVSINRAATWQNQQCGCAPSEDSDQPGHPPSLIRVFSVRLKKALVLSYPLSAQRRLIRLGRCPGWSVSSLGAHSLCWFCHVAAHLI